MSDGVAGKTCEAGFERVSVKAVPEPQSPLGEGVATNDVGIPYEHSSSGDSLKTLLKRFCPAMQCRSLRGRLPPHFRMFSIAFTLIPTVTEL